ncbi:fumarate hydratase C-terminal domain-containing protein [Lutispora sp.]|uniref:fumarate hydratase C-terminal domain-containing protein n=1 Tax=Lutispora sp. TaxID=2828727 RepID=UPI0035668EED
MVTTLKTIYTPITEDMVKDLEVGEMIMISGYIYTGRDAVLPKVVSLIKNNKLQQSGIELNGSVIFHTAVSPAGVGPTSSNKYEIESNIPTLSEAGVKLHLGKGSISKDTIASLNKYNSVYAVIPPVTALLSSKIKSQAVAAFPEEGMEALHLLEVDDFPAIIAVAHGKSIY